MRIFPQPSIATNEPVTLDQLKAKTNIVVGDGGTYDVQLTQCLAAAGQEVETMTSQLFVKRAVTFVFDAWPCTGRWSCDTGEIELGVGPVDPTTVAITFTASDGTTQTLATPGYVVRDRFGATRIRTVAAASWPSLGADGIVTVTATVGWAAPGDLTKVPAWAVDAILVGAVGRFYDQPYHDTVEALIAPYRPVGL